MYQYSYIIDFTGLVRYQQERNVRSELRSCCSTSVMDCEMVSHTPCMAMAGTCTRYCIFSTLICYIRENTLSCIEGGREEGRSKYRCVADRFGFSYRWLEPLLTSYRACVIFELFWRLPYGFVLPRGSR